MKKAVVRPKPTKPKRITLAIKEQEIMKLLCSPRTFTGAWGISGLSQKLWSHPNTNQIAKLQAWCAKLVRCGLVNDHEGLFIATHAGHKLAKTFKW